MLNYTHDSGTAQNNGSGVFDLTGITTRNTSNARRKMVVMLWTYDNDQVGGAGHTDMVPTDVDFDGNTLTEVTTGALPLTWATAFHDTILGTYFLDNFPANANGDLTVTVGDRTFLDTVKYMHFHIFYLEDAASGQPEAGASIGYGSNTANVNQSITTVATNALVLNMCVHRLAAVTMGIDTGTSDSDLTAVGSIIGTQPQLSQAAVAAKTNAGAVQCDWDVSNNAPHGEQMVSIAEDLGSGGTTAALDATGLSRSSGDATLSQTQGLVGSGVSQSIGTGILSQRLAIQATGISAASGAASLALTGSLQGTGLSSSRGFALLQIRQAIDGVGVSQSIGTASLSQTQSISASGVSLGVGAVALRVTQQIQAVGLSAAGGSALLTLSPFVQLRATGAGVSVSFAVLRTTQGMFGSGESRSVGAAELSQLLSIRASGVSRSGGLAVLSGQALVTPVMGGVGSSSTTYSGGVSSSGTYGGGVARSSGNNSGGVSPQ